MCGLALPDGSRGYEWLLFALALLFAFLFSFAFGLALALTFPPFGVLWRGDRA